ncbi:MAG: nucleotidyl transferase AbiEii/AbiGii toxin family protein [Alphaproteobacteria bacterium]|nr:nucleotidyl transferase AbiEii/AbiGii toxin family protein [Alphaproteobacteria bacterium]
MISKAEIKKISLESGLEISQIEKDYVLSWILGAISQDEQLSTSWAFKGGTCLRKCFFKDYRYSEDLDFTIMNKEISTFQSFQHSLTRIAEWILKRTSIEIDIHRSIIEVLHNLSNQEIIQGRIFYRGPSSPSSPRAWPKIKLDITPHEVVVYPLEKHKIIHPYSDNKEIKDFTMNTYSFYDLLAEKMRALFERTRPRDLYDVVEIVKRSPNIDQDKLKKALKEKCRYKNITSLDLRYLKLESCEAGWKDQLSHQLQELPAFKKYLEEFNELYCLFHLKSF